MTNKMFTEHSTLYNTQHAVHKKRALTSLLENILIKPRKLRFDVNIISYVINFYNETACEDILIFCYLIPPYIHKG